MKRGRSFFQVDPKRRNNFRLGLHAEISVRIVPKQRRFEKELKMAGDENKNAIWALLLSLLALINTYNNQLVVTPNEMDLYAVINH